jgi:hypothetical protein
MTKKKKKTEASLTKMTVYYTCDGIPSSADFDSYDLSSSESECDLCGSHGSMTLSFKCPQCENHHNFELKEW